jgi:hypothetical protein
MYFVCVKEDVIENTSPWYDEMYLLLKCLKTKYIEIALNVSEN